MKECGYKQVGTSVARHIVCFHSHAAHGLALPVDGRAAVDATGSQLAVSQVAVLKVRHLVIADAAVGFAVAIEVEDDNPQALTFRLQAGRLADVGESAVAVVAEENARAPREFTGSASLAARRLATLVAAKRIVLEVHHNVPAYE